MYRGRALEGMLSKAEIYEQWKEFLSENAKNSLAAAVVSGLGVLLFLFAHNYFSGGRPIYPDFWLDFTEDWVYSLQVWCFEAAPYLIVGNLMNMGFALIVFLASEGITARVSEPIHWMAYAAGFLAGINVVLASLVVAVGGAVLVLHILWLICMVILAILLAPIAVGAFFASLR
jgi:hypothetical protein